MPRLTEQEQQEIVRFIEGEKPLPDKYRFARQERCRLEACTTSLGPLGTVTIGDSDGPLGTPLGTVTNSIDGFCAGLFNSSLSPNSPQFPKAGRERGLT